MKLYMFRTVPLSIIRSFSLYTQQWYMSYRFADSLRAGSGWNWLWLCLWLWGGLVCNGINVYVAHVFFFPFLNKQLYVCFSFSPFISDTVSEVSGSEYTNKQPQIVLDRVENRVHVWQETKMQGQTRWCHPCYDGFASSDCFLHGFGPWSVAPVES